MNFSAIIINWNTKEHLERCVKSFINDGIPPRSIIVVDQDSRDGSVAMIRRKFPRARVVRNENTGYAHAANIGMDRVRTEFAVIANADVIVRPGCLAVIRKEFGRDRHIGLIGPAVLDPHGRRATRFSRTPVWRGIALEVIPAGSRGMWRDVEQFVHNGRHAIDVTYVEGAFMAVRRSAYEQVAGMDEGFSFFQEDADLPIRMRKAGFRVVHTPAAKVIHIGGASFSLVPARHAAEFYRNMTAFYRRHALRRSVWLARMLRIILHAKRVLLDLGAGGRSAQSKRERNIIILESLRASPLVAARQKKPLISVIIPTFRRPNSVRTILSSLKNQSYKNFEVIVVE